MSLESVVQPGFFFEKRKAKLLIVLLTLTITTSSCVYRSEEEIFSVSHLQTTTTEIILEPTNTSNPTKEPDIKEMESITPTLSLKEPEKIEELTSTKEAELNLEGFYKEISFESKDLLNWYRGFFKPVQIKECPDCSSGEFLDLLEPYEEWILVRNGKVIYVHSGWPLGQEPAFGQMFVLILREGGDLTGVTFCFDDLCFEIRDWVILERDEVGGSIPVNQIFDEIDDDDLYLVTCSQAMIPGLKTPKLLLRLEIKTNP